MTFERKTVEKNVIVKEPENDRQFVRRIINDLVEEFGVSNTFSQCPNFTKTDGCRACKLKTSFMIDPPDSSLRQYNTDCALIAIERLVKFIQKNQRKD